MKSYTNILYIILVTLVLNASVSYGQAAQEEYGKNRIQYKNFRWQYLSSPNFDIYFYEGNEELARNAARYAEAEFSRISDLIGFSPYSKIRLYVYASKADLQQSNVGLEQENSIVGGRTNFVKSIVEVPFTGIQINFRREISKGIAQTLVYDMMYGGSFKDVVQSNYLLLLPDWFMGGVVRYASEGWSVEMDDHVRDAMRNNQWRKPSNLLDEEAEIAGQSIWSFIAEKYGRSNLSNILNLTRILRNEENSIGSTLGVPYDKVIRDWKNYYTAMADAASTSYHIPEKQYRVRRNNRKQAVYNELSFSDNGQYLAYSENREGRYKIILRNLKTNKQQTVWTGGNRLLLQKVDYQMPLLAWQANDVLHFVVSQNGAPMAIAYNLETRKKTRTELYQFKQVLNFDVSADGKTMLLCADNSGQSDIFLLNMGRGSVSNLTKDVYDDKHAQFMGDNIVFSSNRLSDTLGKAATYKNIYNNYNIFIYQNGQKILQRINNTVFNEIRPRVLDAENIVYLSDEKGIFNAKKYNLKTQKEAAISEWEFSIKNYDVNKSTKTVANVLRNDGAEYLYVIPNINFDEEVVNLNTRRQDILGERIVKQNTKTLKINPLDTIAVAKPIALEANQLRPDSMQPKAPKDSIIMLNTNEIDIRNYVFESEKIRKPIIKIQPKLTTIRPSIRDNSTAENAPNTTILGAFPYVNRLSVNNITTTAILDPLRGLGFLLDISMTDMFENHKIKAGLQPFSDLRSSNIFAEYQYLKKRIDFKFRYDKHSYFFSSEQKARRYNLNKFQATAAYPFALAHRVELSPFVAQTRYVDLDNATSSLNQADVKQLYTGLSAEYIYDHTVSHGMNMLEGTRGKVRVEQYVGVGNSIQNFGNIHADIRHYQPLHKELTLALRGSFGHFFGSAPKNYLLGGMDNWIGGDKRFNRTNKPQDPLYEQTNGANNVDWLFMQFATNLRGFKYNTMYGNSYMLFNAELRIPVVRYLYHGPVSSNFLRNFQIVAFTDAGTAWTTGSPFKRDDLSNGTTTNANPFTITVKEIYNPILSSYGLGLRTMVLGYYLKTDMAWGVQNYEVQSPRFYFSLGYDF